VPREPSATLGCSAFGTGDGPVRVLDYEVRGCLADTGPPMVGSSVPAETRCHRARRSASRDRPSSPRAPGLEVVQAVAASPTSRLSSWQGRSRAERWSSSSRRQGTDASLCRAELLVVAVEGLRR